MIKGLSSQQADKLLSQHGLNIIKGKKKKPILKIFLEQFNNFFTILLLMAAITSFFIGEVIDGSLIISIVVLNAFFGIYQEKKAEKALEFLKKMTVSQIRVIRDGKEKEIDSRFLVPGDVFFIEEGVKVPADGLVVQSVNLEINEASLTGESLSIIKKLKDEIFMGTIVSKGRGYIKVVRTGMETKFGKVATKLSQVKQEETPLQGKLKDLSKQIGWIGVGASIIVLILSYLQGSSFFSSFLLAVSLAVAVVPEGLPAVMTMTMALGVSKMAKKKAIVRKLSSIETLGSITLIATDKTGTLTENKMKVKEIFVNGFLYQDFKLMKLEKPIYKFILNGVLCSTASLVYNTDENQYEVLGDPTEGALLFLAKKMGIDPEKERKKWQIIKEDSFDSISKKMSVVVQPIENRNSSKRVVFNKGAPEIILDQSNRMLEKGKVVLLTEEKRQKIISVFNQWTDKGLRVLGFSYSHPLQTVSINKKTNLFDQKNNIFLGLAALHDPARGEVKDALKKARQAGIKVVMITGDNERTAKAIGDNIGLIKQGDNIITGQQLEKYSDNQLLKIFPQVRIFARTSPFHKHRIVKLYQKRGDLVAVTGDGINDAIALKQADVGIAMGRVGTDVARETADIVITDDNFATIVNAIEEGRDISKNIKNAIKYLLSCNVGEAISLIMALFFRVPHLFYAVQLLYINLITDGLPALVLAFSPQSSRVMNKPPDKDLKLMGDKDRKYILYIGMVVSVIVLFSYFWYERKAGVIFGRTAAFSVLTLIQSFILIDVWLNHRSFLKNIKTIFVPLFLVAFIAPFILQYILVSFPQVALLFKITTVSIGVYFQYIILAGLILVGIKKLRIR